MPLSKEDQVQYDNLREYANARGARRRAISRALSLTAKASDGSDEDLAAIRLLVDLEAGARIDARHAQAEFEERFPPRDGRP